jgi:CTP synthase (UTP-ammonia lyase)
MTVSTAHLLRSSNKEKWFMNAALKIGIIGDYDPHLRYHLATNAALRHAGRALAVAVEPSWLPTRSLDNSDCGTTLERFDAVWCAPGSPYTSMSGALKAIQFAREKGWPFTGT